MEKLVLERFAYAPHATFGKLKVSDRFSCYTVERPWLNNKPNISCIPVGLYSLEPSIFHKGGYQSYEVKGVPDRTLIKIHIGNRAEDVQGCIAVGTKIGSLFGEWAVLDSRTAFDKFMHVMGGKHAWLSIENKKVEMVNYENQSY